MGVVAHRPVSLDEHGKVFISHPGGIRRRLPLKTSVLGDGLRSSHFGRLIRRKECEQDREIPEARDFRPNNFTRG